MSCGGQVCLTQLSTRPESISEDLECVCVGGGGGGGGWGVEQVSLHARHWANLPE